MCGGEAAGRTPYEFYKSTMGPKYVSTTLEKGQRAKMKTLIVYLHLLYNIMFENERKDVKQT